MSLPNGEDDPFCTQNVKPGGAIPKATMQHCRMLRNQGKLEKAAYEDGPGWKK